MAGNKQKATGLVAVTPSDTLDLPPGCVGLYIGTAGTISVICGKDSAATPATPVPQGDRPWEVTRVMATGTTATDILACY